MDKFENVLETRDIITEPKVLLPGEKARFSLLLKDIEGTEHYEVKLWYVIKHDKKKR